MIQLQSKYSNVIFCAVFGAIWIMGNTNGFAAESTVTQESTELNTWWFYPLILFLLSFLLGVFAVLAGVGGGVLYVPIVNCSPKRY